MRQRLPPQCFAHTRIQMQATGSCSATTQIPLIFTASCGRRWESTWTSLTCVYEGGSPLPNPHHHPHTFPTHRGIHPTTTPNYLMYLLTVPQAQPLLTHRWPCIESKLQSQPTVPWRMAFVLTAPSQVPMPNPHLSPMPRRLEPTNKQASKHASKQVGTRAH